MNKLHKFNEHWADDELADTNQRMQILDDEEDKKDEQAIRDVVDNYTEEEYELASTISKLNVLSDKLYSKSKKVLKQLKNNPNESFHEEMKVLIQGIEDAAVMLKEKL